MPAARVAAIAKDVTELMAELAADGGLAGATGAGPLRVAYHSACSMQHGQKITTQPKNLLKAAGFTKQSVEGSLQKKTQTRSKLINIRFLSRTEHI